MSSDHSDDQPTVIRPKTVAPAAASAASSDDTLALPIGTRLGEFELTQRIGEGGFGIVYQAWDHTLERRVALKEYLPSSIATRVGATRISARSDRHRETFEAGLKSFINEAKLLARFDHPSLVKVFRFWEANGTAYMVMPFYEGVTMRDTVRALGSPPDEAWLMELLNALTEALAVIHAEQCYHRDIAPDNVMLLAGTGRPLLLDFGAARRVIGDMTQALTVILKPGYAPVEQYAEVPGMKQGPWTDVYALAAVVYWTVTGKTPPPSVGRMLGDSCVPLAEQAAGRYSAHFLAAIDRALAVRPEQRTPDIGTLRHELGLPPAAASGGGGRTVAMDPDVTVIRPASPATRGPTKAIATGAAPTVGAAATVAPATTRAAPRTTTAAPAPAASGPDHEAAPRRSGLGLGLAAAAGVAVLAAGGWWLLRPGAAPTAAAPPPIAAAPAPAPAPAVAPDPAPAAAAAAAPAPVAPPPAPPPPRSPTEAFARWKAARDPALTLAVRAPASVSADAVPRLSARAGQAGYLYLVAYRDGDNELRLWHPATPDGGQRVEAGAASDFGPAAWAAQAPVPGRWHVMVLLNRQPRDLGAAGWRARGGALVRGFDDPAAAWSASDCPPGGAACDAGFAAEELTIEVQPPRKVPAAPPAERKPERPAPSPSPGKPEARTGNSAECARLIQQMSLGDSSAELNARFRALGCR